MEFFARPSLASVNRLLSETGLPNADLSEDSMRHFLGLGSPELPEGIVGLEPHGPVALLRSLVVAKGRRGSGLGRALVAAAERHARHLRVREVYLLTTNAQEFFERLGYERVEREGAPESIRATTEFSSVCPSSAVLMRKRLPGDH